MAPGLLCRDCRKRPESLLRERRRRRLRPGEKPRLCKLRMKPNGYTLHLDPLRVIIATGFRRPTSNTKTGPMIQTWILRRDVTPLTAVATGADRAVCGNCPLRGHKGKDRSCYVVVAQAPNSVYKAFLRGNYPALPSYDLFNDRAVRFGAYGDPAHLPLPIIREIATRAKSFTGYTHKWANSSLAGYREFLMASVESLPGAKAAQSAGWRTFRVIRHHSELAKQELVCVNATRGIQCADCGLCSGNQTKAKSIAIPAHGPGALYFKG